MDNNMLAEMDEVVRLAEKATPGPWALEHERGGDVSIVNREHQGDGWDIATAHYTQPANADLIARSVNFIRTHHAEIAEAVADARRYRWLRDVWGGWMAIGGEMHADIRTPIWRGHWESFDAAIDAQHNSAREGL